MGKKKKSYDTFFTTEGLLKDYQKDLDYVKKDIDSFAGRRPSNTGNTVIINSPRHVITEDYKDYAKRSSIKRSMDDGMWSFLLGLGLIIVGLAIFKISLLNSIICIVFGAIITYFAIKLSSRSSKEYREHINS
jgi:hypothetical protein